MPMATNQPTQATCNHGGWKANPASWRTHQLGVALPELEHASEQQHQRARRQLPQGQHGAGGQQRQPVAQEGQD